MLGAERVEEKLAAQDPVTKGLEEISKRLEAIEKASRKVAVPQVNTMQPNSYGPNSPPPWASELLSRIQLLEAQIKSEMHSQRQVEHFPANNVLIIFLSPVNPSILYILSQA